MEGMKEKDGVKFVINISTHFASKFRHAFRCFCDKNRTSSNFISVPNVLCSPEDDVCHESSKVCLLQKNGTGKCEGGRNICMSGTETPPGFTFNVLVVHGKARVGVRLSCNALLKEESDVTKFEQDVELEGGGAISNFKGKGSRRCGTTFRSSHVTVSMLKIRFPQPPTKNRGSKKSAKNVLLASP